MFFPLAECYKLRTYTTRTDAYIHTPLKPVTAIICQKWSNTWQKHTHTQQKPHKFISFYIYQSFTLIFCGIFSLLVTKIKRCIIIFSALLCQLGESIIQQGLVIQFTYLRIYLMPTQTEEDQRDLVISSQTFKVPLTSINALPNRTGQNLRPLHYIMTEIYRKYYKSSLRISHLWF